MLSNKSRTYEWLNSYHIGKIKEAFSTNFPTYIGMIISCTILCYENMLLGIILYIFCTHLSYYVHILAHQDNAKTINCIHEYHHNYVDNYAHYLQIVLELVTSITPIFIVYLFTNRFYVKNRFEPYVIFMFSLFYSSIHNINYSMLHVNTIHENHHKNWCVNYGPDICDVIYGTKEDYEILEDTSHYLPNLIICTIIASVLYHTIPRLTDSAQMSIIKYMTQTYTYGAMILLMFNINIMFGELDTDKSDFAQNMDDIHKKIYNPPSPSLTRSWYEV